MLSVFVMDSFTLGLIAFPYMLYVLSTKERKVSVLRLIFLGALPYQHDKLKRRKLKIAMVKMKEKMILTNLTLPLSLMQK